MFFNHADESESNSLSVGAAAGITFITTLLVALPVGVVIGLGVAWCAMRHGTSKSQQLQGADYEEPLETVIPLRDNQAYGQVYRQSVEELATHD